MKVAQGERWQRRKDSIELLHSEGITYRLRTEHNAHYLIDEWVDFWPTTGRWSTRTTPRIKGRGAVELVNMIKSQAEYERRRNI